MHCIAFTMPDVFWIDATWSGALPTFILFMALYVSMTVGEEVSMRGSCVDALLLWLLKNKTSWGGNEDWFNKVLKYCCHLATTDSLSDNSCPFADFSGADRVTHFCLSCRIILDLTTKKMVLTCTCYLLRGPRTSLAAELRAELYLAHTSLRWWTSEELVPSAWDTAFAYFRLTSTVERDSRLGMKRLLWGRLILLSFSFNVTTTGKWCQRCDGLCLPQDDSK